MFAILRINYQCALCTQNIPDPKYRLNQKFSYIAVIALLVILNGVQTVFAERIIDFEKVIDVDKKSLEKYFEDINTLETVFPQNIKDIQSLKQTNDNELFKVHLNIEGISLDQKIFYEESENRHILKVLDGDLKGTTISTTLQQTWGFDGSPNQGTIVNMKTSLKASGFLSLVNLLPDRAIHHTYDYGLMSIIADSKGEIIYQEQNEKQNIKKGYRSR